MVSKRCHFFTLLWFVWCQFWHHASRGTRMRSMAPRSIFLVSKYVSTFRRLVWEHFQVFLAIVGTFFRPLEVRQAIFSVPCCHFWQHVWVPCSHFWQNASWGARMRSMAARAIVLVSNQRESLQMTPLIFGEAEKNFRGLSNWVYGTKWPPFI